MQLRLFETPVIDLWHFENRARHRGFQHVAGIDEAGRGPLAGPVVAAAVIFPPGSVVDGVNDSKQLSAESRERLYAEIHAKARAVGIGCVDADVIDRINILQATFRAMVDAVNNLAGRPDYLLIDGPYRLPLPIPQQGIRKGDQQSFSIAAASIIAKVYRDRLMMDYHRLYPEYGFDQNKGYGTRAHRRALARYGPCPIHRRTFKGVLKAAVDGDLTTGHP